MTAPPSRAERRVADQLGRAPTRLVTQVALLAVLLIGGVCGLISVAALDAFEHEVRPEIEREAQVVARLATGPLQRALDLGVPFDQLSGVEEFLDSLRPMQRSIGYFAVTDAQGVLHHHVGVGIERLARLPPPEAVGSLRALPDGYDMALPLHGPVPEALTSAAPPAPPLVGWLHLGFGREGLDIIARDTRWDILIVLLVTILTTIELLRFAIDRTVTAPLTLVGRVVARVARGDWTVRVEGAATDEAGKLLGQINVAVRRVNDRWLRLEWLAGEVAAAGPAAAARARRVLEGLRRGFSFAEGRAGTAEPMPPGAAVARLPLFAFVFGEQLSTSFIPLYGRQLAGPGAEPWLAALPITVFVAAVALATPFGGRFVARHGVRAGILWGAVPALLGHVGCAFAGSVAEFAAARALTGVGYAVVTIACQVYLAEVALTGRLARSLGGFTGAVMTGAVCGTAMGAVVADRIGYAGTFLLSALLVLVVQLGVWRSLPRRSDAAPGQGRANEGSLLLEAARSFRNLRFSSLVLLAAIPAKVLLAGFIFYLAPLELSALGLSPAAVGRNVMLYGLAMLPAIPLGGWLADRMRAEAVLIAVAGLLGGAALLLPGWGEPDWALPTAIALTGFTQGLAAGPMLALVPRLFGGTALQTAPALAFLRLGERIGSVAGPLAAALLATTGSAAWVIGTFGLFSIVTALGYGLVHLLGGRTTGSGTRPGGTA